MFSLGGIIRQIRVKKLTAAVEESKAVMQEYRKEVFNSKILKELMSDTFTYTGKKPDTILVKDSITGKPVELKVQFSYAEGRSHMKKEKYVLSTNDGTLAADKDFYFVRDTDKNLKLE